MNSTLSSGATEWVGVIVYSSAPETASTKFIIIIDHHHHENPFTVMTIDKTEGP